MHAEKTGSDRHLRVISEDGKERLVPEWMFCADAFSSDPVDFPQISLDALRALIRIIQSCDLSFNDQGQKGRSDATAQTISSAGGSNPPSSRRCTQQSALSAVRSLDCSDDGDSKPATIAREAGGQKQ